MQIAGVIYSHEKNVYSKPVCFELAVFPSCSFSLSLCCSLLEAWDAVIFFSRNLESEFLGQ